MVGTHSSAGDAIKFSSAYNDIRPDEGLNERLVFVDDMPFPMEFSRKAFSGAKRRNGVYEVTVPADELEKFSKEDRTSEDNHCHYYYFSFRTGHSRTTYRVPETVSE